MWTGKMTHPQLNVLEADTGEQLAHHDGRLRQDDLVFPAGHIKGWTACQKRIKAKVWEGRLRTRAQAAIA